MATLEAVAPRVLAFDPVAHEYWVDGALVPNVTSLLDDAGLAPDYSAVPRPVLEYARARGLHVDQCIELLDQDQLDFRTVHPEAMPYLDAWLRFREWALERQEH